MLIEWMGWTVHNPYVLVLLVMGLDAWVGELNGLYRWRWLPHPVVALGRLIAVAEARLNRPEGADLAQRLKGLLLVGGLILLSGGLGQLIRVQGGLDWVTRSASAGAWAIWAGGLLLAVSLVAQRSLFEHVWAVAAALQQPQASPAQRLEDGRRAVSMIVGRDPAALDEAAVCRAAIESCAENFSDGVVAPLFWFAVAGLPGLLVYKTVNTLDSMIGHKTPRYRMFGWAAARCDDLLNLVPARLAGGILCLAGLFLDSHAASHGSLGRGFSTMLRDAGKHRSPNAGWPEAACAGVLGLALCGPRLYRGEGLVEEPWLGDGRSEATPEDIERALSLMVAGCVIFALFLIPLAVWWGLRAEGVI